MGRSQLEPPAPEETEALEALQYCMYGLLAWLAGSRRFFNI